MPDWVYVNTASTRKKLQGRDITLLSHVKSMRSGKANFQCRNGHKWRTTPALVADAGEGCPECGIGKRSAEEIRKTIGSGVICLLTHPDKPGLVKIGLAYATMEEVWQNNPWGDWIIHRYRNIEEMVLAEALLWDLLGRPLPHGRKPVKKDLSVVEEAFRKLHSAIQKEIVLEERSKDVLLEAI